ncbi:MAG: hypothetical protein GY793_02680 [Proteobacteria bacterium]|nr:hypothetical protein [Pseudomonadota bacterium]
MATKKFDTFNPDQLTYQNELLKLTILGGIKLEGLDRMRITLKVGLKDSPRPPVRHNLDLYNDNQLEKFIRKCAEKLEIGTSVLAASFSELTEELEHYRLQRIKEQQAALPETKILTAQEKEFAIKQLSAPELLRQTEKDLQQTGIQGEAINSMILFTAMTSRKTHDPLSVICLAKSGVGKSYLMEKVAECFPQEELKEHTQFSGNSFYYYKREEIRGKVFLIEDLDGAQAVMFPIRELQTKKRISKTVTVKDKNGQLRTITLIVEGPVSIIGCTTREKIYEDNANRAILIYLDGTKEQDERIMDYQKQLRAGIINKQQEILMQQKLQNMQRVLEPVKVVNPYATLINIPKEVFKPRRTLPLLLSFIEAVSFYHQYQREQHANEETGEVYIKVYPQDIEQSFTLLKDVLFRKSDELSGAAREFFQMLELWSRESRKMQFYASDIRKDKRIHPRTLNRYLQELTDYGLLQIAGGNKHRTGYAYKIVPNKSFEDLQQSIDKQIETVIKNVWNTYNKELDSKPESMPTKGKAKVSKVGNQLDNKTTDQLKVQKTNTKEAVGQAK